MTEHGTADEVAHADAAFRQVDGRLPDSVLAGYHGWLGDVRIVDRPLPRREFLDRPG